MTLSILDNLLTFQGLLTLTGAVMLVASGLALIASGNRMHQELLARHVELVSPTVPLTTAQDGAPKSSDDPFRRPVRGMPAAQQREIIRRFSRFGITANRALNYFSAARLVFAAILGGLAWLEARNVAAFSASPLLPVAIMAMAAIVSWFLPAMVIAHGVKLRAKAVRSGLPDALELLVVCVEAGLSLEDGLSRVVIELQRSQPALADELRLTLADLTILPSRDQALINLADRVDVPSVRSVVTTLIQTLRYGTPLAQSLRVVASELRNDSLIEMEERANRLPAYLTLPVMLFLMPTIFLIVGGPAALRMLDAFHR